MVALTPTKPVTFALKMFQFLLALAITEFIYRVSQTMAGSGSNILFRLGSYVFYGASMLSPLFIVVLLIVRSKLSCYRNLLFYQLSSLWPLWIYLILLFSSAAISVYTSGAELRISMFITDILPLIACLMFVQSKQELGYLRNIFFVTGILIAALTLISGNIFSLSSPAYGEPARLTLEDNTITTSSNYLLSAISGLSLLFSEKSGLYKKICIGLMIILLIFLAMLTGSRGPLLAFFASAIIIIYFTRYSLTKKVSVTVGIVLIAIVGYGYASLVAPASADRLLVISKDEARYQVFQLVFDTPATLFGHGVGSFKDFSGTIGEHLDYVHNSFLEAYLETGIVGLILFSFIVLSCLKANLLKCLRTGDDTTLFVLAIFVFYLLGSQFSGTFLGYKGLYLAILFSYWNIKVYKNDDNGCTLQTEYGR